MIRFERTSPGADRVAAALMALVLAPSGRACATCFGQSDSPLAEGMNMGILVLLGVILSVLLGVASFFVFVSRRAAAVARAAARPSSGPSSV